MLASLGVTRSQVLMGVLLWCVVWLLSGCGAVGGVVGPEAAKFVNGYCAIASPLERELLRNSVNARIAPNSIAVTCASDVSVEAPPSGEVRL